MSDIASIKARIAKLMAYANDGAASEGEIENAMNHAAKLIDAHHLDADEFKPVEEKPLEFGQAAGTSQNERFSTWESSLAWAVAELFGCVKHYIGQTQPLRINGIAQTDKAGNLRYGRKIMFYGPIQEATEAAELFTEWSASIATMGVIRWGGCFRGDGAMYCMGFATALLNRSREINRSRKLIEVKPSPAESATASTSTALTLASKYDLLKDQGGAWLKNVAGIRLGKGSSRGGYSSGSTSAYNEGKSHGSSAGFGRKSSAKQLPGY